MVVVQSPYSCLTLVSLSLFPSVSLSLCPPHPPHTHTLPLHTHTHPHPLLSSSSQCEPIVCGAPTEALPAEITVTAASLKEINLNKTGNVATDTDGNIRYTFGTSFTLACASGYAPAAANPGALPTAAAGEMVAHAIEVVAAYECTGPTAGAYSPSTEQTVTTTHSPSNKVDVNKDTFKAFPTCAPVACASPTAVQHATALVIGQKYHYGHNLAMTCIPGYATETSRKASQTLYCGADGKFTVPEACTKVECPRSGLPNILHGHMDVKGSNADTQHKYVGERWRRRKRRRNMTPRLCFVCRACVCVCVCVCVCRVVM